MNIAVEISVLVIAFALLLSLIIISVIGWILLSRMISFKEKQLRIGEVSLYNDIFTAQAGMMNLMSEFVSYTYDCYKIMNSEIFSVEFIDEATAQRMVDEIFEETLVSISPVLYNQLALIYTTDHVKLNKIILREIKMIVLEDRARHNQL